MGLEELLGDGFISTRIKDLLAWGRKNSLWPMPFGTACCAIEMMATLSSRYDMARFGAEVIRFSPRQSDLMIVSGRISIKMMPVLIEIYNQMPEPKWCISMGACASTGGVFDTYTLIQEKIRRGEKANQQLYDRIKHPLDFEPVALVSNAAGMQPSLTGTRHSLPEKDIPLEETFAWPQEREVTHVKQNSK